MSDGHPNLTVFRIQREQFHPKDPGHIVVSRKVPARRLMYRLPLKTPSKEPKAVGDEMAPLLGDNWKKPVVRIVFVDGTAVELRKFSKDNPEAPYRIAKLAKGDRLVSHRVEPSRTDVSLAFVNYPASTPSCVLRVWDEQKGKKASTIIRHHRP